MRYKHMSIVTITSDNFESEVLSSDKKVLVDLWAPWCGPCRMLSPIIDEVAESRDDVKFCKINVDDNGDLAKKYNVMSIPTLLVFQNGEVVNKSIGLISKEDVESLIK